MGNLVTGMQNNCSATVDISFNQEKLVLSRRPQAEQQHQNCLDKIVNFAME